jgi:D-glycero-D-manno-heptose 1,7-bisphosphate phosphatase
MNLRKAVFLDLQGTLGGEGLGDVREFRFYPFAFDAIRQLNRSHLLAVIITSQSHIAKGDFSYADFERRMDELNLELNQQGAKFDAVYCCPHGKEDNCSCRKPLPGMALQAHKELNLDLKECYVVGDSGAWDMKLAQAAGCRAILVRTGLGESSLGEYRPLWADMEPDFIADTVLQAVDWIVKKEKNSGIRSESGTS